MQRGSLAIVSRKEGLLSVPFCAFDGFVEIRATLLERMAGTTRLELATSAVTV
jgi:hypothetical protein